MAKTKRGRSQDRRHVAGKQQHELAYMKKKFGICGACTRRRNRAVGNNRKEVEKYLKEKSVP